MNRPESSGTLSTPAAWSANETVPEQSAPRVTSNSRLCPPPYRYGRFWSELAAQIACLTCSGASAGAAAVPSASSTALVPGTSGPVQRPGSSIGGEGGSGSNAVPPVPGVAADAPVGTMTHSTEIRNGATARGNNDMDLFRRPAGLAVGLALKEPAPRDAPVAVRPY